MPTTPHPMRDPSRRSRPGFTLIELMVAMAIGLLVVAAGFTLAAHQVRHLEFTTMELDRDQAGRAALELLVQDLRHGGLALGQPDDGTYPGLLLGNFTATGGGGFNSDNETISLSYGVNDQNLSGTYDIPTDDIGIRFANGDFRSIAAFSGNAGQICTGSSIEANDIVVLLAEDAVYARTVQIASLAPAGACTVGLCLDGCDDFTFNADTQYSTGTPATSVSYLAGEMVGDFREVIWFVNAVDGVGELRRAEASVADPCAARDATCGGIVAEGVETMQVQVWQWNPTTQAWSGPLTAINDRNRVRVDVELVLRARTSQDGVQEPVALALQAGECVPGPCGSKDFIARRALRTSVEIRNAGRGLIMLTRQN